jgi:transposase
LIGESAGFAEELGSMSDIVHAPMAEPARRVEVFTGARQRRTWSAEEKARIIAESYAGDATVAAVARRHGLTRSQLFWWRHVASQGKAEAVGFAPVVVRGAGKAKRRSAARRSEAAKISTAMIEIVVGPAVVRVGEGADEHTLSAVLEAIRHTLV